MKIVLIILAVIFGGFIFLCILAAILGAIERMLHPYGFDVSAELVLEQLRKIAEGRDPYALDDFLSSGLLKDPRFEAKRERIEQLVEESPPGPAGGYFGPKGLEVIRNYIRERERERRPSTYETGHFTLDYQGKMRCFADCNVGRALSLCLDFAF